MLSWCSYQLYKNINQFRWKTKKVLYLQQPSFDYNFFIYFLHTYRSKAYKPGSWNCWSHQWQIWNTCYRSYTSPGAFLIQWSFIKNMLIHCHMQYKIHLFCKYHILLDFLFDIWTVANKPSLNSHKLKNWKWAKMNFRLVWRS